MPIPDHHMRDVIVERGGKQHAARARVDGRKILFNPGTDIKEGDFITQDGFQVTVGPVIPAVGGTDRPDHFEATAQKRRQAPPPPAAAS